MLKDMICAGHLLGGKDACQDRLQKCHCDTNNANYCDTVTRWVTVVFIFIIMKIFAFINSCSSYDKRGVW